MKKAKEDKLRREEQKRMEDSKFVNEGTDPEGQGKNYKPGEWKPPTGKSRK